MKIYEYNVYSITNFMHFFFFSIYNYCINKILLCIYFLVLNPIMKETNNFRFRILN